MKHRIIALLLALLVLLGVLAGCGKKDGDQNGDTTNGAATVVTPTKNDKSQTTAKYAYQARYLSLPEQISSVSDLATAGDTVWVIGRVKDGEKTETYTYYDDEGNEIEDSYTYDLYKSVIYTLNLESGETAELGDLPEPEVEEGWEGDANLHNLQLMDDGTAYVLYTLYQYRYDLPEDFDPETQNEWEFEEYQNLSVLLHVSADGQQQSSVELRVPSDGEENDYSYNEPIYSCRVSADGVIYGSDYNNIYIYDENGTCQGKIESESYSGDMMSYGDQVGMSSYIYDEEAELGRQWFIPINAETKTLDEENKVKLPTNCWQAYPGIEEYDILYNYNNKIFGYISETETTEKLLDWMDCDINPNDMGSFTVLKDGRVVASLSHYDSETGDQTNEIVVMTRVDASTLPEKEVLTLACYYLDYDIREKIVEFNKNSANYRVVVKDYSEYAADGDYDAGITKLNTEIMSGVIPDIFLGESFPMERYAGKGVLADLYTFIDADSELSRESFVPELLAALETDGALYELPTSFTVQTAYGLSKVVDEYETWDIAAVQDALTKLREGACIFDYYTTRSDVMYTCISNNLAAFVDWQTGECSFDSENFMALLEFVKSFPEDFDWDTWYEENQDMDTSDTAMMKNGQKLLNRIYLYSFDDMLYTLGEMTSEKISFVGFPSEDGTSHHLFNTSGSFSISATCAAPEVAWNLMSEMLREDWQSSYNVWNFPVNKAAFDQKLENAMTPEYQLDENGEIMLDENGDPIKIPKMSYYVATDSVSASGSTAVGVVVGGSGVEMAEDGRVDIYELSQEQADQILNLLAETTRVASYDEAIMDIVEDEIAAYFAGQETVETTAAAIQSRVKLYVAEQR